MNFVFWTYFIIKRLELRIFAGRFTRPQKSDVKAVDTQYLTDILSYFRCLVNPVAHLPARIRNIFAYTTPFLVPVADPGGKEGENRGTKKQNTSPPVP